MYNIRQIRAKVRSMTEADMGDLFLEYLKEWMDKNSKTAANIADRTKKSVPKERLSEVFQGKRRVRLIWIVRIAEAFGESAESVFRGLAKKCETWKPKNATIPGAGRGSAKIEVTKSMEEQQAREGLDRRQKSGAK